MFDNVFWKGFFYFFLCDINVKTILSVLCFELFTSIFVNKKKWNKRILTIIFTCCEIF
jgi:hypothetical protein